jgi:hypothetical protein
MKKKQRGNPRNRMNNVENIYWMKNPREHKKEVIKKPSKLQICPTLSLKDYGQDLQNSVSSNIGIMGFVSYIVYSVDCPLYVFTRTTPIIPVMGKHPDLMVAHPTSTIFPTIGRNFEIS